MALSFTNFSRTRCSPIAIDFGADSVKLLQVIPSDPPQLIAAGRAVLPEHARTDPASRTAFLAEALKDLLRSQPFRGKRAILSFPAFQTLMQHMEIGRADGDDVATQVGVQLRTRLNVEPTRMVIRHFPVRQLVRNGVTLREVICLAASREVVMGYLDVAHRCKLDVVGMHTEPIAVLKAFEHLCQTPQDRERATCYVDIGAAMTKVVIAHGTQLVFAKSIHAAGDQITQKLARARRIDFMDAHRLRQGGGETALPASVAAAAGLAGEGDVDGDAAATMASGFAAAGADADGGDRGEGPADCAADTLDCIVDELHLSLRYHETLFPDKPIARLVFLGGEANHVEFCQRIARSMRLAAQLGDPFARMTRIGRVKTAGGVDLDAPQPGWAVPMGLCLSEANL